jgi:hypothetical protein
MLYGAANSTQALGQSLIVAGTVGLMGGLLLIGLGSISARLRRIADGLDAQPFPRSLPTDADLRPPPAAAGASLRAPLDFAPASERLTQPAAAAPEPIATTATLAAIERGLNAPELGPPGPSSVDGPISAAPRVAAAPPARPAERSAAERVSAATAAIGERTPPPPLEPEIIAPPAPAPHHPPEPPPTVIEAPVIHDEPQLIDIEPATAVTEPPFAASDPIAPRVLKSGVIEGMAYTLYADGSVDAELGRGTIHFNSIAEWRAHLRENV